MVKNLKKLRLKKRISQQALAAAIGVSQQSINKYENHGVEPDITTLITMADYFGVTVDYLIGRIDESGDNFQLSGAINIETRYRRLNEREQACIDMVIDTLCDRNHIR